MPDPWISIQHLSHHYENKPVLQSIQLDIYPKEVLTILGPNGAGKTTLLRILSTLEKPITGEVTYRFPHQSPITLSYPSKNQRIQIDQLRPSMLYLFQKPVVFSGSVLDNLQYSARFRHILADRRQIEEVLMQVGILPMLYQNARSLSGGELSRLALARALLVQPSVLFLDEPSANLDPPGMQMMENLLQEWIQKTTMTIVLVTQDLFEAKRISDRVAFLLNGSLIECHPKSTFFSHPTHPLTKQFIHGSIPV
ncbi:MAG: ATP-binding cassette domain-containing protein [Caldisericia bacterium]|nr:ATP-binding cassette domain-containing protein [Caldisericia bacterium]